MEAPPRFCKRCGSPLDPADPVCSTCAALDAPPPRRTVELRRSSPVASALWLYFALLATFVVLVVSEGPKTQLVVDGLDVVIVLFWVLLGIDELRPILKRPADTSWWLYAPLLGACTFLLSSLLAGLLAHQFDLDVESYSQPFLDEGLGWFWVVVSICVQPALMEEFAFRGVIMEGFRGVMSRREVLVVTALMFTVLHVSVPMFPSLFVTGFLLGWLRMQSGSIWPCVLMHFTHNGLVLMQEALGLS